MHVQPGSQHRIALVGATGKIGRAVARVLAGAGADYRVLSRDGERARRTLGPHAQVIQGDLRDDASAEAIVRGADRLLLACSEPSLERRAIAAAMRAGVRRIVMVSPAGPGGGRAGERTEAEEALCSSGIAWTIVRPTALVQSLADAIAAVARDGVARLPAGDAPIAWVDARDVAAVALHALVEDHDGQEWTVTGPEPLSVAQAVETFAHVTGRALRYVATEPEGAAAELRALGIPDPRASEILAQCARWRAGGLERTTDVVSRIARATPRSVARFAATHDFGLAVERSPRATPP